MSITTPFQDVRREKVVQLDVKDWTKIARPAEARPGHIYISGLGAVSPAGWGVDALRAALAAGEPLPIKELARPGWTKSLRVRQVPPPPARPAFLGHARLRRTSPISQYALAAALEAVGGTTTGHQKLGIIYCVMSGCINYSKRFYDEALRDPAMASPLVFPETVFNAPASHLAAFLGSTARNYTLVGDQGAFLQALALAADWLLAGSVDAALVVSADEMDWLGGDAYRLFAPSLVSSEGAGAVLLSTKAEGRTQNEETAVRLAGITDAQTFSRKQSAAKAAQKMRAELPAGDAKSLLCDGRQDLARFDRAETAAWRDWPGARLSPKLVLGEGSAASAAWQCIAAVDAVRSNRYPAAVVSVVGCNQQAIGAHFTT